MSTNTDHSEERIEEKEQHQAGAHQSPSPEKMEPEDGHISVTEGVLEYPDNVAAGPAASAPPSPLLHAATHTQVSLAGAAQPIPAGTEVQLDALPVDAGDIMNSYDDDAAAEAFLAGYFALENLAAYQGEEVPAPDFSSGWFEGPGGGGGVDAGAGAEDDNDEVLLVGVQPKTPEVIYISSDDEESDDDDFTSDSDIDVRESGGEKEDGAEGGDEEVDAGDDGFLDFLNHQDPDPELEGGGIFGLGGDNELEGDEEESLDAPAPDTSPAPATTPASTPAPTQSATPAASGQEVVDIPDIDPPSPSLSPSSPPLPTTHGEKGQAAHAEDWYAQFPDSSRGRELSPISQLLAPFLPGPPSTGAAEGEPKEQPPSLLPLAAAAPAATPGRGERAAQQHIQQGGVRGRRPPPNRPLPWGSVAGLVGVAEIQSRRPGWRPINYRRGAAGGAAGREDDAVSQQQEPSGEAGAGEKRGSEEGEGDEERPAKRRSP